MAKQQLPTNFKDDVLGSQMGGKRRYRIINNEDGTISLEDATEYSQTGSDYGAAQMNATNLAVNESADKNKIIDTLSDIMANDQTGYMAGALAVKELNKVKVLSKDEFGITIDTGHSHVRFGTSVRPTAKDGTGNRYVRLWSAAEIAKLLKVPKIEVQRFDLSIRNGDSTSNPVHFYTPEYWNDGNFYAYTWLGSDGNVRVDYRMECPTVEN